MRARGGDAMPETIPRVGLLIVRSDRPTEAWYQFRSGYQVRPSRLSESHGAGERYEVFICFNRHNPIL